MPEFTGHRDIRAYLRIVWRWKLLILVIVVAAPAIAYLSERGKPNIYESSVLVNVPASSSNSVTNNINTVAALVTTTPVADIAGSLLTPRVAGAEILGDVSASPNVTNGLLTITATTTNPTSAADIANAFAKALGINLHDQVVSQTTGQIGALRAQADQLPKGSAERLSLEQQILTARAQLKTESSGAQIFQAATPNDTPVGPHVRRTVELGFVIGLLIAFALVMVLESADRRLRSPDDLESLTKLPLLAAIGPSAFSGQLDTTPVDEEAFQMLRTSLTYFTVDQRLDSVLIASPSEKEGKTTVAGRLALAAARAGLDVILVDADLRRHGTTEKFGLASQPGLSSALGERRPAETILIDWQLQADGAGRLRLLPAGPTPPNAAALMSSEAMRVLLATLQSQSDLVIIDSPAALAVSDAVPLLSAVSGVILVARMNQSSRDTLRRLQKIVTSAHGRLLGVVATGVTSGPGYEKYSREYYTKAAESDSRKRRRQEPATVQLARAPGSVAPRSDHQQSET